MASVPGQQSPLLPTTAVLCYPFSMIPLIICGCSDQSKCLQPAPRRSPEISASHGVEERCFSSWIHQVGAGPGESRPGTPGQQAAASGSCRPQAASRAAALGLGKRAVQEAPAPEVTTLLSDPGHIRWLPCLPWPPAPVAPSGRAGELLRSFFRARSLI